MLFEPETYEDLIKIVEKCKIENKTIFPIGTGKHIIGKFPKTDFIVSLRKLSSIIEVSQSDLYVTAQAGVLVKSLNEELKKEGLWLPFDYDGTLGGLTAINLPLWYTYPRELLLGARFVNGEGKIIKSGGKTTKFSSGYKIWKVLAGSLGRLGVILELTYKVLPLPEVVVNTIFNPNEINSIFKYSPLSVMVIIKENEEIGIARFVGLKKVIDKIPLRAYDGEIMLEGENIISLISPLGLELTQVRILRKFMKVEVSISLIGKGYTRAVVKDFNGIEEARANGLNVLIERGNYNGEYFNYYSKSLKYIKQALDPFNIFPF
jgi:hypothetical protein